jgi:hypothetical protein
MIFAGIGRTARTKAIRRIGSTRGAYYDHSDFSNHHAMIKAIITELLMRPSMNQL